MKRLEVVDTNLILVLEENEAYTVNAGHPNGNRTPLNWTVKELALVAIFGDNPEKTIKIWELTDNLCIEDSTLLNRIKKINNKFKKRTGVDKDLLFHYSDVHTFKLDCKKYTEPQIFTYADFLDVFLSPISVVKLNNEHEVNKSDLNEKEKIDLFFSLSDDTGGTDVYQKLRNLYRFYSNNNGKRLDSGFETVRTKLKGCIVANDLIPYEISSGITPNETKEVLEAYLKKMENWEKPESSIFTKEKYPTEKLCAIINNGDVEKYVSSVWTSAICNIDDETERFRKWDSFIVGLYFIALANFKTDEESEEFETSRQNFVNILWIKLRSLFSPADSGDAEIRVIIYEIELYYRNGFMTREDRDARLDTLYSKNQNMYLVNTDLMEHDHGVVHSRRI